MKGHTNRDIQFRGPSAIASGTIKAGTPVEFVTKDGWSSWVVSHQKDAPFFDAHD